MADQLWLMTRIREERIRLKTGPGQYEGCMLRVVLRTPVMQTGNDDDDDDDDDHKVTVKTLD